MKNDFTQLLIDIQKKSGITVENVRDIKNLKEEIEGQTNKKIGYNTLRRFFGFLPRTVPSKTTLTMLSNYLGFATYSNYINNKLNFDEWYFQQKLIKIQLNNELDAHVISFIEVGLTNKNNIVAVANYIGYLIRQNNLTALEYVFSGLAFKNLPDSECLKFSTIVTFNLLTIEKEKALAIYKKLLSITSFRKLVPSYYIDYTNLGGIYFEVLQLIKETSPQQSDVFFASLMQFYKRYYFLDNVENEIEINLPVDFDSYHHVLKGRFLGYLILKSQGIDTDLEKYVLHEFKKNRISLLSQEVITSLIIKEEYNLLSLLYEKYYEDIFDSSSWSYKTTNSINLIGLANVNWYNQKYVSAKNNLELVELEKVELGYFSYISLFYYLTQIKISYSENDIETNKKAIINLKKNIEKTQFIRFEEVAASYIIK
jgi:hypothetical protein